MFRLFESLTFKTRLAGSYTVLVALLLLVSVVSMSSQRSTNRSVVDIGQNWLPSVHVVDSLNGSLWEYRATVLRHIISSSPQEMQRLEDELVDIEQKVEQQLADYARLISSDNERNLHREISEGWARYNKFTIEQVLALSRSLRTEDAMHQVQTQASLFATLSNNLSQLVAINQKGSQDSVASSAAAYSRSMTLSVILLVLAVATAVGMTLLMLRSSSRQLGGDPALAQDVVIRMSRGEFDTDIPLQAGDRQSVLAGMRQLQLALQELAQSQNDMLVQHASGVSSHRIDISRLHGGYQKLASISNQLMDQRIALMDEVVTLMQQYSRGDFRNQLRVLPGELRELTEVFGRVRQQLIKLKDASLDLAAAASRGDFSRRGQASEFEFDFREIIDALNNLMANADGGLTEVGKVLGRMADGDLNSRVEGSFEGRFAELRDDTNQMAQQLVQIVSTIIDGSVQVDQAAREIAAANQDLSARTEQQAASLEETASSMEEFTSTVRQNAENARAANQLALNAGGVAERGGAVVGEVVTTMSDIAATSRKISDITSVIDGIAFQTNILALNAAVEAARAGEQGRGFAVVASEVRSLAQRAGTAAREIKGLVDESSSRVETGVKMVQQAGDTMRDILDSVKRLGDLVVEITSASQEQTQGIEQVSTTISQMDQVTQQNAAMVEEAAAAARSLQGQAETLTQAVGFFKIDRVRERGAPRQSASKPASAPAATNARRGAPTESATKPRAAGTAKAGRSATAAAAAPASDQWESF